MLNSVLQVAELLLRGLLPCGQGSDHAVLKLVYPLLLLAQPTLRVNQPCAQVACLLGFGLQQLVHAAA